MFPAIQRLSLRDHPGVYCTSLILVLLIIVLNACGSTGASNSGSGSGQAQNTPTAPQKVQNCGSLHAVRLQIVPADSAKAKQDETCFSQAYSQCHPATLVYSLNSLDTGTIHNLALNNVNGKCTISDGVQQYIAPNPPRSTTAYICHDLSMQADGLHISSCGDFGNLFIPLGSTQ